ncbi:hypothetical protein, partial [Thiolapillus sp.]
TEKTGASPNIAPERAKCGFFTMNYSLLREEYAGYSLYLSCYPVFPGIFSPSLPERPASR